MKAKKETEAQEMTPEAQAEKEFVFPSPCVYCGPSVRGVSQQYAVYTAGVPKPLMDFVREHPAARGLVVPVGRFPKTRERLETAGTREALLFQQVKNELLKKE